MPLELIIPSVGESITEVQIGEWHKQEGDVVDRDEVVVTIESEKATLEIPAPARGTLRRILKRQGETATVGEVIGYFDEAPAAKAGAAPRARETAPIAAAAAAPPGDAAARSAKRISPVARKVAEEHGLSSDDLAPAGAGGRIVKEDVLRQVREQESRERPRDAAARSSGAAARSLDGGDRTEELVPMSPLRRTIARRLVEASQQAALLTTFNDADMSAVAELRARHKEAFREKHGVKLGLLSFFVKATIEALKEIPQLNAEVRGGDSIAYRGYYDVGIAVGGGKGLVVPVLRNADRMSFAEIEKAIADFAARALENEIRLEELQGGTFTISNGGVYGSLLSTPIVNPPQSGVLGLHRIEDRPVARGGQVVIRPMMYLALTYDHRIVDGREAVAFLKRIKEAIEEPARLLLEV
jgi:2-oxoglutarate dehydrogenase E2 component (dihydrolipoamide succinyltransferase)